MTESDWTTCTDPLPMLEFLYNKDNDRKLRLFAVGCCRRVGTLVENGLCKNAVDTMERFCDGAVTSAQASDAIQRVHARLAELEGSASTSASILLRQMQTVLDCCRFSPYGAAWHTAQSTAALQADMACLPDDWFADQSHTTYATTRNDAETKQTQLLRDIFGNPFHSVNLKPAWLSSSVTNLAESIYADRSFEKMPILADALEDAGCTSVEILEHCRSGQTHTKGCWALDLVLGKE